MLDLNELEKRLDDALDNETEESLTDWLNDQRKNNDDIDIEIEEEPIE